MRWLVVTFVLISMSNNARLQRCFTLPPSKARQHSGVSLVTILSNSAVERGEGAIEKVQDGNKIGV